MRFTIRDVLWLMVVVGLAVLWQQERLAHLAAKKGWRDLYKWTTWSAVGPPPTSPQEPPP